MIIIFNIFLLSKYLQFIYKFNTFINLFKTKTNQ